MKQQQKHGHSGHHTHARDPIELDIDRETDQQFWAQTGLPEGHYLNPKDPADAELINTWLAIRFAVATEVAQAEVHAQEVNRRAQEALVEMEPNEPVSGDPQGHRSYLDLIVDESNKLDAAVRATDAEVAAQYTPDQAWFVTSYWRPFVLEWQHALPSGLATQAESAVLAWAVRLADYQNHYAKLLMDAGGSWGFDLTRPSLQVSGDPEMTMGRLHAIKADAQAGASWLLNDRGTTIVAFRSPAAAGRPGTDLIPFDMPPIAARAAAAAWFTGQLSDPTLVYAAWFDAADPVAWPGPVQDNFGDAITVGAARGGASRASGPSRHGMPRRLDSGRVDGRSFESTGEGPGDIPLDTNEDDAMSNGTAISGGGHHHHHSGRGRRRNYGGGGWGYPYYDYGYPYWDGGDDIDIYTDEVNIVGANTRDPWRHMQGSPPAPFQILPVGNGGPTHWTPRGPQRYRVGALADVAPVLAPGSNGYSVCLQLDANQVLHGSICVDGKCYQTSLDLTRAIAGVMQSLAGKHGSDMPGPAAVASVDKAVSAAGKQLVRTLVDRHLDTACAGWLDDIGDAIGSGIGAVTGAIGSTINALKGPISMAAGLAAGAGAMFIPGIGPLIAPMAGKMANDLVNSMASGPKQAAAKQQVATAKAAAQTDPHVRRALHHANKAVAHTAIAYHVAETAKRAAMGDPTAMNAIRAIGQSSQQGDPAASIALDLANKTADAASGQPGWLDKLGDSISSTARNLWDPRAKNPESVMSDKYQVDPNLIEMEDNVSGTFSVVALVIAALGGYAWSKQARIDKNAASEALRLAAAADAARVEAEKAALTAQAMKLAEQATFGFMTDAPLTQSVVAGGGCGSRMYTGIVAGTINKILKALYDDGAAITGTNPWNVVTNKHGVELRGTWDRATKTLIIEVTNSDFIASCDRVWEAIDPMLQGLGATPVVSGSIGPLSPGTTSTTVLRNSAQHWASKTPSRFVGVLRGANGTDTWRFESADDADDWFGSLEPRNFEYAAYYDKSDALWPRPLNEAVGQARVKAA